MWQSCDQCNSIEVLLQHLGDRMSTLESLAFAEPHIVNNGFTHQLIVIELQQHYLSLRGLSARGVHYRNQIHHSSHLSNHEVDDIVEWYVGQVGPSYGRRTLTDLLWSNGIIIVGEQRVRGAMRRVTPVDVEIQINPTPHCTQYFGHKLHIYQNEKLVNFGVTRGSSWSRE